MLVYDKIVNRSNALIYVYVFLMLLFLFLKNVWGVGVPVSFFLLITAVPVIFGNNTHVIAVGLSCIPFSTGFQYKIALFFCVLSLLLKNGNCLKLSKPFYFVFAMMVWEFLHFYCGDFSINEFFRSFAELMFFAVISCVNLDDVDIKVLFRVFSVCVVGVCGIMLYMQMQKYGYDLSSVFARSNSKYRFGSMNSESINFGLNFNSNGLGYICNLSTCCMFFLVGTGLAKRIDYFLLVLSILFGMTTLSRTFFICLFVIMLLYVFSSSKDIKKSFTKIGFIAVLFGVIYIIVNVFLPQLPINFFNRFDDSDVSNGRVNLFAFYLKHIFSSPQYVFFGIGLQNFQIKLTSIYGVFVQVCHNGFEEVWVAWGAPGVVLFFGMLWDMFRSFIKRNYDHKILRLLPLFILIFDTSAGQLIRAGNAMLSIAIVYVALNVYIPKRIGV